MTSKPRFAALLLLWLSNSDCIVREPGTSVEVTALSHATAATRSALTSDLGYQVQLDQLYLVLSQVELIPCPGSQRVSMLRSLFGPSIAHAHGTNTATAWTVPNVLAPLADNAPISIAVMHPPAIAYCALRVSLAAADADAERMPQELDLHGLSMLVTGAYGLDNTAPRVPFRYQSIVSSTHELPLLDATGKPTTLVLSEDNLHVTLRVELLYQQLFDGLSLFPGAFSTFGDVVLGQILDYATVVVLDDAG